MATQGVGTIAMNRANRRKNNETSEIRRKKKRKPRSEEEHAFDIDLIDHVQVHQILWDYRQPGQENTEEIWREIGSALGKSWFDCKSRWQDIRNYFITLNNDLPPSGSAYEAARDKIRWPLFKRAEFIRDSLKKYSKTTEGFTMGESDESGNMSTGSDRRIKRKRKAVGGPVVVEQRQQPNASACNAAFGAFVSSVLDSFSAEKSRLLQVKMMQILSEAMTEMTDI